MTINYKQEDLFKVESYYAHCISRDFKMMKGIALQFNHKFDMKNKLKELVKVQPEQFNSKCILRDYTFNLITKNYYYQKPNLDSLKISLEQLKEQLVNMNINYIRIPLIGCGLDKLSWKDVEKLLHQIFDDTPIIFDVCYLEKEKWKVRDFVGSKN